MHGNQWMSTNIDLSEMERLRRVGSGDLLWFRRGGKEYVIRETALLQEAKGLFAPLRALDPEREEIHRRERALDRRNRSSTGKRRPSTRSGTASRDDDDDGEEAPEAVATRSSATWNGAAASSRSGSGRCEKERREIEQLERVFDRKEEELEKKAETALWKLLDQAVATGMAPPYAK